MSTETLQSALQTIRILGGKAAVATRQQDAALARFYRTHANRTRDAAGLSYQEPDEAYRQGYAASWPLRT